jgi:hypothetical protein
MNRQRATVTVAAGHMKSAEQTLAVFLENSEPARRHFPPLGAIAPFRRAEFPKRTTRTSFEITQPVRPTDEICPRQPFVERFVSLIDDEFTDRRETAPHDFVAELRSKRQSETSTDETDRARRAPPDRAASFWRNRQTRAEKVTDRETKSAPPSARLSDDKPDARHVTKVQSVRLMPRDVGRRRLEKDSLKKFRNDERGRSSRPGGPIDELGW